MTNISPFHLTPDDLGDLDRKTRDGLAPMIDALNITLQQLVAAAAASPSEQYVPVSLVVDAVVADSFPIVFRHAIERPVAVLLANIQPKDPDHPLTTPFVMQGFSLTDGGLVSIPWITGVLPLNSYSLTFLVR